MSAARQELCMLLDEIVRLASEVDPPGVYAILRRAAIDAAAELGRQPDAGVRGPGGFRFEAIQPEGCPVYLLQRTHKGTGREEFMVYGPSWRRAEAAADALARGGGPVGDWLPLSQALAAARAVEEVAA